MPVFLYRCPNTGFTVQGFTADDATNDDTYEPITCTACTRIHLINAKTGKILGGDDE